jgi:hypothetical protein
MQSWCSLSQDIATYCKPSQDIANSRKLLRATAQLEEHNNNHDKTAFFAIYRSSFKLSQSHCKLSQFFQVVAELANKFANYGKLLQRSWKLLRT